MLKLKVIKETEKGIYIELPKNLFKAKGIPDYITIKLDKAEWIY